ncbi:hypothetical protein QOZ80_3AG0247630 [Eleusine coracana subsp. coracana]|nr:hypothetical protein QOZ80_3AG0247630 [Eleusine coracana subsp. coracana]
MGAGGIRFSSHIASSALTAVSVVLILVCLYWRFIWQVKKHATSTSASSPLPLCHREGQGPWRARDTSQPLPLFIRVEMRDEEKADCAVCLAELGAEEVAARLVPGCGHGFHVECIEAWFRVNSTCPLCRAAVAAAGRDAGPGAPRCSSV